MLIIIKYLRLYGKPSLQQKWILGCIKLKIRDKVSKAGATLMLNLGLLKWYQQLNFGLLLLFISSICYFILIQVHVKNLYSLMNFIFSSFLYICFISFPFMFITSSMKIFISISKCWAPLEYRLFPWVTLSLYYKSLCDHYFQLTLCQKGRSINLYLSFTLQDKH